MDSWVNRGEHDVIEYLQAENRILREHLGGSRVRGALGERHLRLVVSEFAALYHLERDHQGLDNRLIERARRQPPDVGRVSCRERLGGVLNFYDREAA